MVDFFYTGSHNAPPHDTSNAASSFFNIEIFKLADKYGLSQLAQIASNKFCLCINQEWKSPEFSNVIRELYDHCPANDISKTMREAVINICIKNGEELVKCPKHVEFRSAVSDIDLFWGDFVVLDEKIKLQKTSLKRRLALTAWNKKVACEKFVGTNKKGIKDA